MPKTSSVDDVFEAIARNQSGYATVGAAWVLELCTLNEAVHRQLRGFLVRGGAVSVPDREMAASSFGATLLELYSSKEAGPIAHPCPVNPGVFHVNDEAVLLEIVDEAGQAVPTGVAGRLIVTPFTSTALPLIRYDQGDVAVAGQACACGRGLSVVRSILGREYDVFRHPSGKTLFAGVPLGALRSVIGAKRWQIAQVDPTSYVVRLPPGIAYVESGFDEFAHKARQVLFGDAVISFERDCVLAANSAGKFKEYVNEWAPRGH